MIKREGDSSSSSSSKGNSCSTTAAACRSKLDPRVVRVSKAFGGKDRHSKVCTVRGLRDRRVRLSVPTAIQLYDLQDRLGLNQPSKVVDWLLNAARQEIDGLPPLQFPILIPPPHHDFIPNNSQVPATLKFTAAHGNDHRDPCGVSRTPPSLLSSAPFNSWEPSNLTLSQPPAQQHDHDLDNFTLGSHQQQLQLLYQAAQPYFPTFQGLRPFQFSMTTADLLPPNNDQSKHDDLHSS